ncbi:eIF4E1 [Symbiodinium sp. CCMP2592]|nr:eIF4E1 [Symbiodinium sp. CCMP2592]|mmetsp:Transcript_146891/g.208224  ORF Transcript_146891/g.208224 Transcript_146891/m.208224 type:complete len:230 (+) Transcript_146891:86-775(+)|eukprot:s4489_g9.t1
MATGLETAEAQEPEQPEQADSQDGPPPPLKHELQHRWCLWLHQQGEKAHQSGQAWNESQRSVHSFKTAEDFWCMYHHAYPPSKMEHVDYSLFKEGITPAWEDAALKNGGRWVMKLEKVRAQTLDDLWLSVELALIGEAFLPKGGEVVAGAVVSIRSRISKIALWLTQAKDEKKVMALGRFYREVLAGTPGCQDYINRELTFEDFKKGGVTFLINKSNSQSDQQTAGIFQ